MFLKLAELNLFKYKLQTICMHIADIQTSFHSSANIKRAEVYLRNNTSPLNLSFLLNIE